MHTKQINRLSIFVLLGSFALAGCTVTVPENGGYPQPIIQPRPGPQPQPWPQPLKLVRSEREFLGTFPKKEECTDAEETIFR